MFSTDPSRLLFFARKKSLQRMSLDTPDPADVVVPVPGIQHAVAIDFDPVDINLSIGAMMKSLKLRNPK